MEGVQHSGADEPPPPQQPSVSVTRLHSLTPADLLLPATFLAITLVAILFVLLILVIWVRGHLTHAPRPKLLTPLHHFRVVIDEAQDTADKSPHIKFIDEDAVTPPILKMKKSGGSSPKIPGHEDDRKDASGNSTPASASKLAKTDTKFVFPPGEEGASTSKGKTAKIKVALPEHQWILHRKPPLDWTGYNINIPKTFGLLDAVRADLETDTTSPDNAKKFSATRSPSLEKDERSPLFGMKNEPPIIFGFGCDVSKKSLDVRSGNTSPIIEVRVQPLATDSHCAIEIEKSDKSRLSKSPDVQSDRNVQEKEKNVISRRFGSLNTGLHINTMIENINQNSSTEKSEMQNSPRIFEAGGKENVPSPRFSYSPKFFATPDSKSPKFFGTPDQKSPKFFATPDHKSPAFFAENQSRNASPKSFEKQHSPRLFSTSSYKSIQSPLIMSSSTGECFRFERSESIDSNKISTVDEVDNVFVSKKIDSLDLDLGLSPQESAREKTDLEKLPHVTIDIQLPLTLSQDRLLNNIAVADKSVHVGEIRPSLSSIESSQDSQEINDNKTEPIKEIIIDTSHLGNTSQPGSFDSDNIVSNKPSLSVREESQESLGVPCTTSGNTANYRRQRLKSISLDSDNARFIEQNLGIPIVKHLKQENLYDLDSSETQSNENVEYSSEISPRILRKSNYFNFEHDKATYSNFGNGNENCEADITTIIQSDNMRASPDIVSPKFLRDNSSAIAFSEMQPRFSPKEFEASFSIETTKTNKNIRNLTIDINKRDEELEKELREYDCLDSGEKRVTPKTPTLKVKATSLDSSETLNLSLPQSNTLQVPQNSISVPNTPKRQMKRALSQKGGKLVKGSHYNPTNYGSNLNELVPRMCPESQQRKLYMNVKCPSNYIDSGIFLRENHANLMLFQSSKYSVSRGFNVNSSNFSRRMGSFDENMVDLSESGAQVLKQRDSADNRLSLLHKPCDSNLLGSNLSSFKQNLSVSSTNLKTLPEGVPSNDFDTHCTDEKSSKKTLLQRRGSNQSLTINLDGGGTSLKYSTLSLQGSNLSLASFGASSHNLTNIKNSASNFSLNTDNRQKKNILERRNSNTSLTLNLDYSVPHSRLYTGSNCNLQGSHYSLSNDNQNSTQTKKCLLQRRGSNTSLTLNLQGSSNSNLNRCTSNSSLNIHNENKAGKKKGLLERRSSNTSLTLNINTANPQFDSNRVLSVSNYNLDGSGCTLSRYNSNQSINTSNEHKKGLLERRSSNTSLTLNLNNSSYNVQGCSTDVMRDIEIDENVMQANLTEYDCYKSLEIPHSQQQREKHRKSLSTENLFPKSYKSRTFHCKNTDSVYSFGSHDNLWSNSYTSENYTENIDQIAGGQNLTYICGDQENEMIYAFGDRQNIENAGFQTTVPVRNITTKPLSPHSTSEDFKMYLANIQHLQNASNTLTRQQLKDLNTVFQDGYSKEECPLLSKKSPTDLLTAQLTHLMLDKDDGSNEGEYNPQRLLPEPVLPSLEYQKTLLRNLHQEFWDLPTNFQEKPMVFGSHPKNRYKTILPNEHSRVILRPEAGETEEGYINANYVKGHEYTKNCYIATQGPLQNTIYDFWLMVYQNSCQFHKDGCTKTNEDRHFGSPQARTKKSQDAPERSPDSQVGIQKIVMLTNLIENGRQKCEKYFPSELNEEMIFHHPPASGYSACSGGSFFQDTTTLETSKVDDSDANSFKIKNIGVTNKTGYTIRKLLVEYSNKWVISAKQSSIVENVIVKQRDKQTSEVIKNFKENFEIIVDKPQADDKLSKTESEPGINSLIVYHYWFDNWADHKCPKDVTALLDLSMDVMRNKVQTFEEEIIKGKSTLSTRADFISSRTKSFDKPDVLQKASMDKSKTYFDFSLYSQDKVSDSSKSSTLDIDTEDAPRERRLSAFQLAKAFFDEASRANASDDMKSGLRKNSLTTRLDLPKGRYELRRESTGRIDKQFSSVKYVETDSVMSEKLTVKTQTELREMPPIIVHCSAGIGRTGCLIAILNGIRQLKSDQRVDILGIVCNMRLNRGGMVQNSEQYELVHKVLCLYEELGLPEVD